MTNPERVSVVMTPEMAATVRDAVEAGEFGSTNEVLLEAIRDWVIRRIKRQAAIPEIRRLWTEGLASGPSIDGEVVLDRVWRSLESNVTDLDS